MIAIMEYAAWERINIGVFLLSVVMLAIVLLRAKKVSGSIKEEIPDETKKRVSGKL